MARATLSLTVSAPHEILKWSADRPDWQRDALRRIIAIGDISKSGLAELERLCRKTHSADAAEEPPISAEPLTADHLPPPPTAATSVTLLAIGGLQRVNRLPSDQVLTFGAAPGLTVVYGDNGSGKSGYARVIKKACRTRGTPPNIKPNAFAPQPKESAAAEITCRAGNNDQVISWSDGVSPHLCLANIFVFDAFAAGHYLQQDGPAVFTPHGLDVLQKLTLACDTLTNRFTTEIDQINATIAAAAKSWKCPDNTKVAALINTLDANTAPTDLLALAVFTDKHAKQLTELNEALRADPKQKAKETRASATRLRTLASKTASSAESLAKEKLDALRNLLRDAQAAGAAVRAFASGQFDASYLAGTGSPAWQALFEAARNFSANEAYLGEEFPALSDGAKCVLCQQSLDEQAANRFRAFDDFCKNQSHRISLEATNSLRSATAKIESLEFLHPELMKVDADLLGASDEQKMAIAIFVKTADHSLATVKQNLAKQEWLEEPIHLPASPQPVLNAIADELDQRAILEESADNPDERAKLTAARDELVAQEWLVAAQKDVVEQIDRYKLVARLEACKKDTATRGITEKSNALTKQIVTDAFCQRFEAETKTLGLNTISVKLDHIKGKKGEVKFGLRIVGAESHKIHEVASEGEQRCIALAAFLAELSQASHQSALVFDDPVSSLDHWNRNTIAERLVKESLCRQVIVLTHDAVFLNDLQTHAHKHKATPTYRFLEWAGDLPGQCQDGLPWDCKSPEDRIDELEKRQRAIAKTWSPHPSEANKADMRSAYSWLRATLERIVERVVFADVVFRFRSYVKLKDLKQVVGFSHSECDELQRLHKKSCDVTDAHDPASGRQAPLPTPPELAKDIEDANALLERIRLRCKTTTAATTTKTVAAQS